MSIKYDKLLLNRPYDYFTIYENGKYIFEKGKNIKIELMSTTKSIIAILFSLLIQKNKKLKNRQIKYYYPDIKKNITIDQLITHKSGLQDKQITTEIYTSEDIVSYALSLSVKAIGRYKYSNSGYNLLADIYIKETGISVKDGLLKNFPFLKGSISWDKDKKGNYYGMANLQMKPRKLIELLDYMIHYKNDVLNYMIDNEYAIDYICGNYYTFVVGWLGQYVIFNPIDSIIIIRLKISPLIEYYKKNKHVTEKDIMKIENKYTEDKLLINLCNKLK